MRFLEVGHERSASTPATVELIEPPCRQLSGHRDMTNTIEQMSVRKKSFALHAKGLCRPHRAASAAPEAGPSRFMKQG